MKCYDKFKREQPASNTNPTMKKHFLFPLVAVAGLAGMAAIGALVGPTEGMIADNKTDIDRCIELKGDTDACDRIKTTSGYVLDGYQPTIDIALGLRKDALRQAEVIEQKRAADLAEARKKADAALAKQAADREQAAAKAKADFEAEGWWEQEPGIFVRWCGGEHGYCPGEESYQDYSWRAMVWCKERACGDIYARMNISQNGTVVGWTNETAYGGYGQNVVITFGSYISCSGSIVEFNARG